MKADRSGEDGEYRHGAGSGSRQQDDVSILQIRIDMHRVLDLEKPNCVCCVAEHVFVAEVPNGI